MIIEFDIFKPYNDRLIQGFTTKALGSLNPEEPDFDQQMMKLEKRIGARPAFGHQIHGDSILHIQETPKERPQGDGFMTNRRNLTIGVRVADCAGILLFDPANNAVAAVHSGWRGATHNIVGKAVQKMAEAFGSRPSHILAAIGPSIGPCCLEFTDPEKELPKALQPYVTKCYLDLWSLTASQLAEAGVGNIELKAECTKCNQNKYFSHRNGETGRMAVFIGLKE